MPDHDPYNTDWLTLGARICAAPPRELYQIGDRVTEPKSGIVLTVTSCIKGYVTAERRDTLPDGRKLFACSISAPGAGFVLFARAGDNRPEPTPKPPRPLTAVERLELSHDGRIPQRDLDRARREDAEAAAALFAQDGERPLMQAAE